MVEEWADDVMLNVVPGDQLDGAENIDVRARLPIEICWQSGKGLTGFIMDDTMTMHFTRIPGTS